MFGRDGEVPGGGFCDCPKGRRLGSPSEDDLPVLGRAPEADRHLRPFSVPAKAADTVPRSAARVVPAHRATADNVRIPP